MESKTTKYILGFSLLAIWSLFFLRVKERVNKQNEFAVVDQVPETNLSSASNENYELLLTYADPFRIGKIKKRQAVRGTIQKTVKPNKKKERGNNEKRNRRGKAKKVVPKKRPEYIYKGYIVVRGGKRVALVNDGARNYNLGIGEKIQETTLTQIFEDSIQMRIGEELISFPKFNR